MPAGFYQVPGLPYPRVTDPNRNRDLLGNVMDPAMEPDQGIGAQPPRDPAMAGLPPAPGPAAPAVTRLAPSRTSPFSRADAQALAALDPRALDEAKSLAALPESTPAKITGSFGGRNFEMQPAARVDRNALARLYAQAQERKGQERQDAVRGQEQAGKERLVTIPGEQLTARRKMELETEASQSEADRAFKRPTRDAEIAARQADVEANRARAGREAATFNERVTPQQEALDAAYERAQQSPFAQTTAGRAAIAKLFPQTTAGRGLPADVAQGVTAAETQGGGTAAAVSAVMEDPSIAKLVETARSTRPGVLTGFQGRQRNAAIQRLIRRTVEDIASRNGADPNELMAIITSQING